MKQGRDELCTVRAVEFAVDWTASSAKNLRLLDGGSGRGYSQHGIGGTFSIQVSKGA